MFEKTKTIYLIRSGVHSIFLAIESATYNKRESYELEYRRARDAVPLIGAIKLRARLNKTEIP